MRYVLLIYGSEAVTAGMTQEEHTALMLGHAAFAQEAQQRSLLTGGAPLQPTSTATTVRVRNGKPLITDGPFTETKEQLAGIYILNCKDLDEALEMAARIPYQVPPADAILERIDAVLSVLYLIFNAGYTAPMGDELIRHDLCAEAIRLTRILTTLLAKEPELTEDAEALGLLALMLLQDSRRKARVSADGELVLLEDQERTLWDQEEIAEGAELLERALAMRSPGPYQTQAAISASQAP